MTEFSCFASSEASIPSPPQHPAPQQPAFLACGPWVPAPLSRWTLQKELFPTSSPSCTLGRVHLSFLLAPLRKREELGRLVTPGRGRHPGWVWAESLGWTPRQILSAVPSPLSVTPGPSHFFAGLDKFRMGCRGYPLTVPGSAGPREGRLCLSNWDHCCPTP